MVNCLICGSTEDLTREHIIPQTLWKRFSVDPNSDNGDVSKTWTTLCQSCNAATAALHGRTEMMSLIETGSPAAKQTLQHLADWAFWVLLLLGLAQGASVIPEDEARALLLGRFSDRTRASVPRGVRVYAGIATTLDSRGGPDTTSFVVARVDDPSIYNDDAAGAPIGMSARTGQALQAAQSIGIGKVVLLVLAPTRSSGKDHEVRLDAAAATVGLDRIHPLPTPIPTLAPRAFDLDGVNDLFISVPFAGDLTLLPAPLRQLLEAFGRGS